MRKIWANQLLPKALKSCPKSNKSPNLITLVERENFCFKGEIIFQMQKSIRIILFQRRHFSVHVDSILLALKCVEKS